MDNAVQVTKTAAWSLRFLCFLCEVGVLLSPQSITEAASRKNDIVVSQRCIACDIPLQNTAFSKAHWEEVLLTHNIRIFTLPVGHVPTDTIEGLASLEVGLCDGNDIHDGSALRRDDSIP